MEEMQKDIKVLKAALLDEDEKITDIMPRPLSSIEALQQFEEQIDDALRKRLLNVLASLQGGSDAAKICRKIMRTCMTNGCMSQFSGTGQKGKARFMDTKLFTIVIGAGRKA
ncbi:uncharacterized protein LOC125662062 [Ostrea edulis]|uniref:uncharacterized protein LOC125662062 n=1 Tax=Ostrea edulis TaxID=37623 RepID=UPI0024AF7F59|nr:uncharacterized protein LOC125662062 [Ostrea edulis]